MRANMHPSQPSCYGVQRPSERKPGHMGLLLPVCIPQNSLLLSQWHLRCILYGSGAEPAGHDLVPVKLRHRQRRI